MTAKGSAFQRTDNKTRKTFVLHVGVTEEWGERFTKVAKARGVPASSLAREALEGWLADEERLAAQRDAKEGE